jgi:cytochrome c-type biogenesis protein CcsB
MEVFLLKAALFFYLLSTGAFLLPLLSKRVVPRTIGPGLLFAAFLSHAAAIVVRSLAAGYIAVTNAHEAVSFFACLIAGLCLLVQLRTRTSLALLGAVVSPIGFILTLGAFVFYTQVRDLPPVLQSVWMPVHVTLALLGNAVFGLAFSASLLYLVQEKQLKAKKGRTLFLRLPSLETLDELNYRSLSWGFPLLTLGILSGAVWAEYAWGHFWVWEPRLLLSVLTWVLYAFLLHYRTVGWRGRRAAALTIVCFAVLFISFLGVRFLPGRHGGQFG